MFQRRDYGELVLDTLLEKGIINNELYEKCSSNGGNKRLNYKIRRSFKQFQEDTYGLKHEKSIVTDKDGNVIWSMKGNNHTVPIWKDIHKLNELHEQYGALHFDHNHPSYSEDKGYYPNILSDSDLECMGYLHHDANSDVGGLFKSITAECNTGSRMTILRKETFNMEDYDNYYKACDSYKKYMDNMNDKYMDMYKDVNHQRYLFKEENGREPSDDELKRIENKVGWEYYDMFLDGLKPVQKEFNECNMELIVDWV